MKKRILFGGPTPSPPRGGLGWGHLQKRKKSIVKVICFDVPGFYWEGTLRLIKTFETPSYSQYAKTCKPFFSTH
jgi:hypothetical protein